MSAYLGPSQPDSAVQRWWEMAGAAHASLAETDGHLDPQVLRDGGKAINGLDVTLSDLLWQQFAGWTAPLWRRVPKVGVMKAALHMLQCRMPDGEPPASVERLAMAARQHQFPRPRRHPVAAGASSGSTTPTIGSCSWLPPLASRARPR